MSVAPSPPPSALSVVADERFVWAYVWPLVAHGDGDPRPERFAVTVHRNRADGRVVAAIDFAGSTRVFVKLYPDVAAARAVYRIHDELARIGFGPDSPHRVPRALGLVEQHTAVVVEQAAGSPLGLAAYAGDAAEAELGVRRAARWLAALHASPVAVGPRETVAQGAYRLAARATKAAALHPPLQPVFREALTELGRRCTTAAEPLTYVLTHGRFHGGHVFLASDCVTAIDLDRAALADPSKDIAEYLFGLRGLVARRLVPEVRADELCGAFLDEYSRHARVVLSELTYYWSYAIVWTLLAMAFKERPRRRGWQERVDFLRAEFEDAPRRAASWVGGGSIAASTGGLLQSNA